MVPSFPIDARVDRFEIYDRAVTYHQVISTEAELRAVYGAASRRVQSKIRPAIDSASAAFIARSPFVLVSTGGPDGLDVSPRGGRPGFVKVLSPGALAIPDMSGNNLLDTLTNVVETGRIGLLFVVPGKDETVRVNGAAQVVTDDDVLDLFVDDARRPRAAIAVDVEQVYVHCAKAFRRSSLWDSSSWAALADAPDASDVLSCQAVIDIPAEEFRAAMEAGYAEELAAEHP
jgi:uncharacterized protein